jgi:hypothetical protein
MKMTELDGIYCAANGVDEQIPTSVLTISNQAVMSRYMKLQKII